MSEKISIQQIADALSQRMTYPKKLTDAFVRSLIDTIIEGLKEEGVVKVKGLGTFKVVEVESRESVNVSDGKRIIIPSFKKLSFVPDDAVNEKLLFTTEEKSESLETESEVEQQQEQGTKDEEPTVEEPLSEEPQAMEAQLNEAELQPIVESKATPEVKPSLPTDEFSKIDNIIATPEIVDEALSRLEIIRDRRNQLQVELELYRLQAEEARNNVEIAKEKVVEAEETVRRAEDSLQQARQNLTGAEADKDKKENLAEQTSKTLDEVGEEILSVESEIERLMNEEKTPLEDDSRSDDASQGISDVDDDKAAFNFDDGLSGEETIIHLTDKEGKHKVSAKWTVALVFLLLLFVGVGFLPKFLNKQKSHEVKPEPVEIKDTLDKTDEEPEVKVVPIESVDEESDSILYDSDVATSQEENVDEKKTEEVNDEPERPKTYIIKKGESLTRIAVRFYGSKDAVRDIINANNFANPNNIPIGTTINLP